MMSKGLHLVEPLNVVNGFVECGWHLAACVVTDGTAPCGSEAVSKWVSK